MLSLVLPHMVRSFCRTVSTVDSAVETAKSDIKENLDRRLLDEGYLLFLPAANLDDFIKYLQSKCSRLVRNG